MYKISVPIIVTASTFDAKKVIEDSKLLGAERVFLAIDFLSHDKAVMEGYYDAIARALPQFKAEGLEVGVWFWTFRFFNEEPRYTVMVNSLLENCRTTTVKYCPLDEGFLGFMSENYLSSSNCKEDKRFSTFFKYSISPHSEPNISLSPTA